MHFAVEGSTRFAFNDYVFNKNISENIDKNKVVSVPLARFIEIQETHGKISPDVGQTLGPTFGSHLIGL